MAVAILINGRFDARIECSDRGFQYGDGVFTTLSVRRHRPLLLHRHVSRLVRDCDRLLIPPPDFSRIAFEVHRLCRLQPDGVLKIQITRGSGGRGYRLPETPRPTRVLSLHAPPGHDPAIQQRGAWVRVCAQRLGFNPALAGVKHMNRLEQILARAEWADDRWQEGLLLDQDECLVEGTMSNLFLVRTGHLVTPMLDRCGVAGVMREVVAEIALANGMPVEERRVSLSDLAEADEAFLTNAVIGIWPVGRIDARELPVGPVTRQLGIGLDQHLRMDAGA